MKKGRILGVLLAAAMAFGEVTDTIKRKRKIKEER